MGCTPASLGVAQLHDCVEIPDLNISGGYTQGYWGHHHFNGSIHKQKHDGKVLLAFRVDGRMPSWAAKSSIWICELQPSPLTPSGWKVATTPTRILWPINANAVEDIGIENICNQTKEMIALGSHQANEVKIHVCGPTAKDACVCYSATALAC